MENTGEVIVVTKRNVNNEPRPKQVNTTAMNLEKILNPSILARAPPVVLLKPTKEKTKKDKVKKTKKKGGIGSITEEAARYDVVSALANAAPGRSFGK